MADFHKKTPGNHGAFARNHRKGTATVVTVPFEIHIYLQSSCIQIMKPSVSSSAQCPPSQMRRALTFLPMS